MSSQLPPSGLLGSLRGLATGLLGSVHDRVELISIELHEEKQRLIRTFVWVTVSLFAALLAVGFISFAIVIACWNTAARLPVVAALAVVYAIAAVACGIKARNAVTRAPRPLAATLEELESDRECLPPNN